MKTTLRKRTEQLTSKQKGPPYVEILNCHPLEEESENRFGRVEFQQRNSVEVLTLEDTHMVSFVIHERQGW